MKRGNDLHRHREAEYNIPHPRSPSRGQMPIRRDESADRYVLCSCSTVIQQRNAGEHTSPAPLVSHL